MTKSASLKLFILLLLVPLIAHSQNFTSGFNFYLPPGDTGSTRFIPRFLRSPLTDQDFVSIDGNGHFSVKGAPVRFFGANLVADGAFPTISKAASVAGRLRKMGFNLVRFHHMDNPWSSGSLFIQGSTTRQLNSTTLDRFEKTIAEMKTNGIYADINLHVSRTFTAQDGLPDSDSLKDFCKAINYFDPVVLALHKEFARQLLEHVNPYTGRSLANDPVMAMVEITNENSLYRYWRDGALKPFAQGGILTVRHTKMLDTLWLSFLKGRYTSTSLLAAAWNVGSHQSNQGNQLVNGSFEDLRFMTPWVMELHSSASAYMLRDSVMPESGKYSAAVVVTQTDGFDWHLQWKQIGLRMIKDTLYLVSFAARSDSFRSISVSLMKDVNPWTWYGGATISLTPQWKSYSFSVRAPESTDSARLSFTVGGQVGIYWFDDLSMTVAGADGLIADESFETSSVRRIDYASCPQFTDQRVRDMSSFYIKLEDDYFAHMRRYLKDTLNVKVPVVGTNWNIGPADMVVQSKLDYIDNHAYWDHPSFPGTPWSATDWRIANTPMVQSQDGGTVARLMCAVPMSGKPFTISEYNHPFPNRFQSEALLFITGYGSFHNADAVMFFEYNSSSDDWDTDKVPNYFSIHRNSAMMALTPSCAFAFRMGLISAARQTLTVNYAPDDYLTLPRRDPSGWEGPNLVDRLLTLSHAVRTGSFSSSKPFDPLSLPPTPVQPYVTDTKEITWDTRGLLSVASGRFVGATGFLEDFTNLRIGPVSLKAASGFGAFTLVSLTSDSLQQAQLSLLTVSTKLQNSGMVWDGTTSIHDNWGNAPTQVAPLILTLQIALRADSIRVYPLDPSGRETHGFVTYVPSSPNLFTLTIDQSKQQSMWFGIEKFGSGVSTAVGERAADVPKKFSLRQNYPNPFNPATNFEFWIANFGFVSLKVFDALGREIATLVDDVRQPGVYKVRWDASSLPSGVYFCRLTVCDALESSVPVFTQMRKLTLLK
jgi:hypothetical protein